MKAIVFDNSGIPEEVLQLREVPLPVIGDNEVLVKMTSASINPGDFLFIQNLYPEPKKPVFPGQIAGNHGAGIIEKAGKNVKLPIGTPVAFSYYSTWAEYAAIPQEWLIPLPVGYPGHLAGQLVNLITAWDLLEQSSVQPGQWLALTAGNAAVSRLVTQFAKHKDIRIISIVRQQHTIHGPAATATIPLSRLTADIRSHIMHITDNQGIHGLIDNVGGPVTGELIRSMAFGGRVVINGGMSPDNFALHNFDILLNGVEIKPHVYRYFFNPPTPKDNEMLATIINISSAATFHEPTGRLYDLRDFRVAIEGSAHKTQEGKQFFRF